MSLYAELIQSRIVERIARWLNKLKPSILVGDSGSEAGVTHWQLMQGTPCRIWIIRVVGKLIVFLHLTGLVRYHSPSPYRKSNRYDTFLFVTLNSIQSRIIERIAKGRINLKLSELVGDSVSNLDYSGGRKTHRFPPPYGLGSLSLTIALPKIQPE